MAAEEIRKEISRTLSSESSDPISTSKFSDSKSGNKRQKDKALSKAIKGECNCITVRAKLWSKVYKFSRQFWRGPCFPLIHFLIISDSNYTRKIP